MQKIIDGLLILILFLAIACVECDNYVPMIICVLCALGLYVTDKTYLLRNINTKEQSNAGRERKKAS